MPKEKEKAYYIVNPRGTIHVVNEAHARARLKIVGWRLATKDEIQKYIDAKGFQEFDEPLATPFSPIPPDVQELPDSLTIQPNEKGAKRGKAQAEVTE